MSGQLAGLENAENAVSIAPTASHLDTLACALALRGDFKLARARQAEALRLSPGTPEYAGRLKLFEQGQDCTGQL